MRLLCRSGGTATYNTAHLFKTNAFMLRRLTRLLRISEHEMFLLGAAAGEQGGEHLHALFKLLFHLLANGQEGSHRVHAGALPRAGRRRIWPLTVPLRLQAELGAALRVFEFDDDNDGWTLVEARGAQKQRKKRAAKAVSAAAAAAAPTLGGAAAKPLKCAVCKEKELTAADDAHVLPSSSSPAHFRCYGFFSKMCCDCFEVAVFVKELCGGPEPTGRAKAFLETTEGKRIAENALSPAWSTRPSRSATRQRTLQRKRAAERKPHPPTPTMTTAMRLAAATTTTTPHDDDGELHNKTPPTPCLWQAPASAQKTKRDDDAATGPSPSAAAAPPPAVVNVSLEVREASRSMAQSLGFGGGLGGLLA